MTFWDEAASFLTPLRHRRYEVRRLKLRGSTQALTLMGDGPCLDSALVKLGLETEHESLEPPVGFLGLRARITAAGRAGDLVLARIPRRLPSTAPGDPPLGPRSPEFIGAAAPVAEIMERVRARKDNDIKVAARVVRQQGLSRIQTRDGEAFERFYRDFYRHFVTTRFGERVLLRSSAALQKRLRHGCVQFTMEGEEELAGGLLEYSGKTMRKLVFGSPLPIEQIHSRRLDGVAKYHAALHAAEMGFTWLDFGASDPFASDGILQRKLFWRSRLVVQRFCRWDLLAHWCEDGPLVRRYLAAAPIVRNLEGGFDILIGDGGSLPCCTFEDRLIGTIRHVGDAPRSLDNGKDWPVVSLGWRASAQL